MVIHNSSPIASQRARGTLLVHTCARAMTKPLEWVLASTLDMEVRVDWHPQPLAPHLMRTEVEWLTEAGKAAAIASQLMKIPHMRFDLTELVAAGGSQRFSYSESLGLFRADIDVHGETMVNEQRLRMALHRHADSPEELHQALNNMLGVAWDAELEPFRLASDGDGVRWVHRAV